MITATPIVDEHGRPLATLLHVGGHVLTDRDNPATTTIRLRVVECDGEFTVDRDGAQPITRTRKIHALRLALMDAAPELAAHLADGQRVVVEVGR